MTRKLRLGSINPVLGESKIIVAFRGRRGDEKKFTSTSSEHCTRHSFVYDCSREGDCRYSCLFSWVLHTEKSSSSFSRLHMVIGTSYNPAWLSLSAWMFRLLYVSSCSEYSRPISSDLTFSLPELKRLLFIWKHMASMRWIYRSVVITLPPTFMSDISFFRIGKLKRRVQWVTWQNKFERWPTRQTPSFEQSVRALSCFAKRSTRRITFRACGKAHGPQAFNIYLAVSNILATIRQSLSDLQLDSH